MSMFRLLRANADDESAFVNLVCAVQLSYGQHIQGRCFDMDVTIAKYFTQYDTVFR